MTPSTKPWWRSRMLWLNAIAMALVAVEQNLGTLKPEMRAEFYTWLSFSLPVANMILRTITTQALTVGSSGSGQ